MMKKIISINSGSSSLKFQVFELPEYNVLIKGIFERISDPTGTVLKYQTKDKNEENRLTTATHEAAVDYLLQLLLSEKIIQNFSEIEGIGHRVAHGGEYFKQATLINENVIQKIEAISHLAPLHNPVNLIGIKTFSKKLPTVPQVAVFDTSFHQSIAPKRYIYPIPYHYYREDGIRKYGFHGTSHQFVAQKVVRKMGKNIQDLKIISCHLGNGASICAIKDGKSYDTSMGFTPLAGVMMGTRSGDIDPSIVTFLQKEKEITASEMEVILNNQSGLKGVSEMSNDVRDLIEVAKENELANLALDIYTERIKATIGSYAAEMGGLDVLIFTAGVGENSDFIRLKSCENLEFMGIEVDQKRNSTNESIISSKNSQVTIFVIATNEELMIAEEVAKLV